MRAAHGRHPWADREPPPWTGQGFGTHTVSSIESRHELRGQSVADGDAGEVSVRRPPAA
ncbi:MAG TPA: hypothetical protein VMD56_00195 [Steroidobacteraceae bacterium]|nr:hypothetical protein [Steroidobacteraceae bacterium]